MGSASLVIFSIPKAFDGTTGVQQRNAIQSWLRLGDGIEVLLVGDDPGTAEVAAEYRVRHISEIERNPFGTPLVNSIFGRATAVANAGLFCYVNADIILMSDFPSAIRTAGSEPFLMCGQRWDLDLNDAIDFGSPEWEVDLRRRVETNGRLHGVTGIDYFVFRKGLFDALPPFAIGRTVWDNWLIFHARSQRARIVDSTRSVMAVHQNHGYGHVKGGEEAAWTGQEAIHNGALANDMLYPFTIEDATWQLGSGAPTRVVALARLPRLLQGEIAIRVRQHNTVRHLLASAARTAVAGLRRLAG